mmetsp:Transcript_8235/g.18166  ORF Transcript_8235/g.18166 Transcript_8235/m.18166 type:complete len:146 (+) Transcript_8235:456-893(+)
MFHYKPSHASQTPDAPRTSCLMMAPFISLHQRWHVIVDPRSMKSGGSSSVYLVGHWRDYKRLHQVISPSGMLMHMRTEHIHFLFLNSEYKMSFLSWSTSCAQHYDFWHIRTEGCTELPDGRQLRQQLSQHLRRSARVQHTTTTYP